MAYPIRVGLSNHCPFTLTSSPRSGLILCDHTRYGASMSFTISVQVKTQARKQEIVKISPEEYQVSVHAGPVAGKANQEVIELLARYFSVPKSVLRGQSSRKKLVEVD